MNGYYRCTGCQTYRDSATRTLDPSLFLARCWRCGKTTLHRLATDEMSGSPDTVPRDVERGRAEKERGIARVQSAAGVNQWATAFDQEVARLARSGATFTSEDVTAVVGQPPSSGAVGARMNAAARHGIIRRVGYRQAERVNQHATMISEWQGV